MSSQRAASGRPEEGTRSEESVREPLRTPPEQPPKGEESAAIPREPTAEQARAFNRIADVMEHLVQGGIGRPARAERPALERLAKRKTRNFFGSNDEDPTRAEDWLEDMGRVLDEIHCTDNERVECMVSLLQCDAYRWWTSITNVARPEAITWEFFQEEFRKNYVGRTFIKDKRMEFISLKQKEKSVMEYKVEFIKLSKYGPELIPNNEERCRKFYDGLNLELQRSLLTLETEDFNKLVEAALKAERLRNIERARVKKRSAPRGGTSSTGNPSKK